MSITRYDPFRDLRTLQDEVNRLFSSNFSRSFGDEGFARGAWAPSVDIYENKDQIVLEAELPGMNREDFELTVENNVLTLRGERRFEKKDETDNYHRVELKGEAAEAGAPKTIEAKAEGEKPAAGGQANTANA